MNNREIARGIVCETCIPDHEEKMRLFKKIETALNETEIRGAEKMQKAAAKLIKERADDHKESKDVRHRFAGDALNMYSRQIRSLQSKKIIGDET